MSDAEQRREKELMLMEQILYGDTDALEEIISIYMPLVYSAARRFLSFSSKISREELIQAGILGLLEAISHFSPSRGTLLGTYAFPWIIGEMKQEIKRAMDPFGIYARRKQVELMEEKLITEYRRSPTLAEISRACGLSMEEIAEITVLSNPGIDVDSREIVSSNIQAHQNFQETVELRLAIEALEKKERVLILLRYFRDKTQKEVSILLGLSQAQVSRTEQRALEKLRALLV